MHEAVTTLFRLVYRQLLCTGSRDRNGQARLKVHSRGKGQPSALTRRPSSDKQQGQGRRLIQAIEDLHSFAKVESYQAAYELADSLITRFAGQAVADGLDHLGDIDFAQGHDSILAKAQELSMGGGAPLGPLVGRWR